MKYESKRELGLLSTKLRDYDYDYDYDYDCDCDCD
jgi:hypothetical protein